MYSKWFSGDCSDYLKEEALVYREAFGRQFTSGDVNLVFKGHPTECETYLGKAKFGRPFLVPVLYIGESLFMAISPLEVQSQVAPILDSFGHCAVFGFGLGFSALKMAEKKEVSKVSVIESNPHILKLAEKLLKHSSVAGKIDLKEGCFYRSKLELGEFDFVYNDIYEHQMSLESIKDAIEVKESRQGVEYRFWMEDFIPLRAKWRSDLDIPLTESEEKIWSWHMSEGEYYYPKELDDYAVDSILYYRGIISKTSFKLRLNKHIRRNCA